MGDHGKRKLRAKPILTDIRFGMDAAALSRKYGLSDKQIESVCRQLSAAGALTEQEVRRLRGLQGSSDSSHEGPVGPEWRCPACSAPQAVQMLECPVCGVVVSKFTGSKGTARHISGVAPHVPGDSAPRGGTGWLSVILSIVFLALLGSALLVWSTHRAKEASKISALDPGTQSQQQIGTDADRPQESSGDSEPSKDYTEVEVEDSQETVVPPGPIAVGPQEAPNRRAAIPREKAPPITERPEYVTGLLRWFSSADFKREVVEASKTYPVLFQFYSNT